MEIEALKRWFIQTKRELPWREDPTPYRVWVSEIMLQQTRAKVVIPYFLRWMDSFPTIFDLANSPLEQVIKQWEGLGYYSRARNLHAGAQYVVEKFAGHLPQESSQLSSIKGLGPYTVAAIQAFAFKQRQAAVDGNVLRVIARLYNIDEPINEGKVVAKIRDIAQALLPEEEPWIVAEALIELGATLCGRRPLCEACPLSPNCKAYQKGTQQQLPKKKSPSPSKKIFRSVAVIKSPFGLLLRRGEEGKVMQDLWEFPYFDIAEEGETFASLQQKFSLSLTYCYSLPSIAHSFTRFQVRLDPVVFSCSSAQNVEGYEWIEWEKIFSLPFSSGHKRILQQIESR